MIVLLLIIAGGLIFSAYNIGCIWAYERHAKQQRRGPTTSDLGLTPAQAERLQRDMAALQASGISAKEALRRMQRASNALERKPK